MRKRQKVPLWQWVKQTGNVFQCLPLKTAGDLQFVNPSEKELQRRLVHSQIHVENLQWKLNAILFVYGNSYFSYFNDEFNYRKGNLWGGTMWVFLHFSSRYQSLQRIKYIYQVQHLGQLEVFSFVFSVLIRNLKTSSLFFCLNLEHFFMCPVNQKRNTISQWVFCLPDFKHAILFMCAVLFHTKIFIQDLTA